MEEDKKEKTNKIDDASTNKDELPLIDNNDEDPTSPIPMGKSEDKTNVFKDVLSIIRALVIGIAIGTAILTSMKFMGIKTVRVDGTSMYPTYKDNTLLVLKQESPKHNNIIVFNPDKAWDKKYNSKLYIKRLVAKPGDKLVIKDNKVTVNGRLFRKMSPFYSEGITDLSITIPKNKYFVMGDNYTQSNDSLYNYKIHNSNFLIDSSQVKFTAPGKAMSK